MEREEKIALELLLETIYKKYGHDFRQYSRATILRRVRQVMDREGFKRIAEMIPLVLYDPAFFEKLLRNFSITVSELFRTPLFYKSLREEVIPYLKTHPFVKIWVAGCATGEEVYSLAILLKEEEFYDRTTLFATDFNDDALEKARIGVYSLQKIRDFTSNYQKAGGKTSFSQYYHAQYDSAIFDPSLKKNITFANHNLVTDSPFGEMHLILCRNVLIYFDSELQNKVISLFSDSLVYNGFLCLGDKESLRFSSFKTTFKEIDRKYKIYQKRTPPPGLPQGSEEHRE